MISQDILARINIRKIAPFSVMHQQVNYNGEATSGI